MPASAHADAGSVAIVESSPHRVKFAAGAYVGDLDLNPQQMAVFLYYLDVSCCCAAAASTMVLSAQCRASCLTWHMF